MNKYNDEFLKEIGLDQLEDERKEEIMAKLDEVFQKFLTLELANNLSEEDLQKTENLNSVEELEELLDSKGVDYKVIAAAVAQNIKAFVKENMIYLQGYVDSTLDNNTSNE